MSLKKEDVEKMLRDFLTEVQPDIKAEDLTDDAELTALGVESLDVIEMLFEVEDQYGVTVPDEVVQSFVTFKDVVSYIMENHEDVAADAG